MTILDYVYETIAKQYGLPCKKIDPKLALELLTDLLIQHEASTGSIHQYDTMLPRITEKVNEEANQRFGVVQNA